MIRMCLVCYVDFIYEQKFTIFDVLTKMWTIPNVTHSSWGWWGGVNMMLVCPVFYIGIIYIPKSSYFS